jgi:hypothetical protein
MRPGFNSQQPECVMNYLKIKCSFCDKKFLKSARRINEAKKLGWKFYCSSSCQHKSRTKQKTFKCSNPICNNFFGRAPNDVRTKNLFCSQACAAIVNNRARSIKTKIKICPICRRNFYSANKYCSRNCYTKIANYTKKIPTDEYKQRIIYRIVSFHNQNNRIPVKREFYGMYLTTRKLFGTWNNAIKAAGFEPNPVLFANKFIAKDGHRCDSLTEKIIDDWLFKNNIEHKRNVFYPNSRYTADFKIGEKFVEFFGLKGELKQYDKNLKIKERIARENKIELIKIYPKDLFPKNRLSEIIKI